MVCFHPLTGFRAPGGRVTLRRSEGYSDLPVTIACGQCQGCRLERSRQWAVRCMHEMREHDRSSFITLTYSDENLPPDGGLDVAHWQKFAKRVRKALGPFRFFHCGEYGDRTWRPHYHAVVFGHDFRSDRKLVKRSKRGDHEQWTSPELEKLWPHGIHLVGTATFESAAYVARYVMKKQTGANASVYGGRKAPYVTMSRRPGIGSAFIKKYGGEVYRDDFVVVNGKPARPPKYYDGQWELVDPERIDQVKTRRKEKAARRAADNTTERLAVRERLAEAKLKTFKGRDL